MKIIDILNKKANGELKDGFEFKYNNSYFVYFKKVNEIQKLENGERIGNIYSLENCLNDEIETVEENKEIDEFPGEYYIELKKGHYNLENILNGTRTDLKRYHDKINELVQAVNKLSKEREEK